MNDFPATTITASHPSPSRLRLLAAIFQQLGRSALARLSGQPNREQAALEFVRSQAVEGDADSVLDALDRFSCEQRFLVNVGRRKGRILDRLVAELPTNARVLELGTYCGYSAVRMARRLPGGGQIVSIEANARYAKIARAICRFAGLEDRVHVFVGEASELISKLAGPFDLVFMDHRRDEYLIDLWRIEDGRLIEPGGMIVANKVGPHFDARMYLSYVRGDGPYKSHYVESSPEYHDELVDGLEISVWRGARKEAASLPRVGELSPIRSLLE